MDRRPIGRMKGERLAMSTLHRRLGHLPSRLEDGQGLAEYALILALVAIVVIVALQFLGQQISTIMSTVGNSI
jgi:pilus assembly protein Flp/PilA